MGNKFDSLLARGTLGLSPFGYEKEAGGVEAPDQGQLEQDFARLAYMFLQDRASGLIKYLLGFEVVNRDDDGSRAVGIFGFKIGPEYYYVPAFFLNNQVKGIDMLFSKKTNMFMPLTEDWINFIINRQTIELGGGTNVNDIQRHFESPNFSFIASPPVGGAKAAEARTIGSSIDDAFDTWNKMQQWTLEHLEKDAEFQKSWAGFICAVTGDDLPFEKTAESSTLIRFLQQDGGPKAVDTLLAAMSNNAKFANAALQFYPGVESFCVRDFSTRLAPKQANAKVEVVTSPDACCSMDSDSKKRLIRDGFTIKDDRKDEEKSEVYTVEGVRRYSSPQESGTYQVLLSGGNTTKSWVILPTGTATGKHAVVVEQDKRMWRLADPEAVFVRDDEASQGHVKDKKDETPSPYSKAIEPMSMEIDAEYVLVNQKGDGTKPFRISSTVAENGKRVRVRVRWCYGSVTEKADYGHDFSTLRTGRDRQCRDVEKDLDYMEFGQHKGRLTVSGSDTLVVPSDWKALKLYDDSGESYDKSQAMREAFKLGSMSDADEALTKEALSRFTVASDDHGVEYYFDVNHQLTRPMGYKQAYVELVTRYGLPVKAAEDMLVEASTQFKSRRFVKFAQEIQSPMVGVNMPYPYERPPSIDPYNGVPVYENHEQEQRGTMMGVPPKPQPNVYGMNLGGEADMDVNAMQLAQQAGQAGQKKIFDHAAIGGLSKTYDTGSVIDSYVPELMKALDRIGRLIFLFYWKNEDFSERYGSNDMPEMEDLIRNVFKSFGELALQLRKKAIGNDDSNTVEM